MAWQDLAFVIGNIFFVFALIPSLKSKNKPSFYTSFPSTLILLVFAISLASLELWASAMATLTVASLWGILALQKYKNR